MQGLNFFGKGKNNAEKGQKRQKKVKNAQNIQKIAKFFTFFKKGTFINVNIACMKGLTLPCIV